MTKPGSVQPPTKKELREAWMKLAEYVDREKDYLCYAIGDMHVPDSINTAMDDQVNCDLGRHAYADSAAMSGADLFPNDLNPHMPLGNQMRVLYCLLQAEMCR